MKIIVTYHLQAFKNQIAQKPQNKIRTSFKKDHLQDECNTSSESGSQKSKGKTSK